MIPRAVRVHRLCSLNGVYMIFLPTVGFIRILLLFLTGSLFVFLPLPWDPSSSQVPAPRRACPGFSPLSPRFFSWPLFPKHDLFFPPSPPATVMAGHALQSLARPFSLFLKPSNAHPPMGWLEAVLFCVFFFLNLFFFVLFLPSPGRVGGEAISLAHAAFFRRRLVRAPVSGRFAHRPVKVGLSVSHALWRTFVWLFNLSFLLLGRSPLLDPVMSFSSDLLFLVGGGERGGLLEKLGPLFPLPWLRTDSFPGPSPAV